MINEAILVCVVGLIAHRFCAWLPGKDLGPITFLRHQDPDAERHDHDHTLLALLVILCALLWAQWLIP